MMSVCSVLAVAESVSGSVTNGSTGKVAAGVSVTLVDPMGGMSELATAKTDAHGKFKLEAPAATGPRLARAERGGVNYFKMITPGATSVELKVYDAAEKVEGINGAADVLKMQSDGSTLQAVELFAVRNQSSPPKTLTGAATFEFVLPDGAQVDGADVQGPNGQPISATPKPRTKKNHFAFEYPLKPGETRFQVSYHLPYSGRLTIAPQLTKDFEHYVLMIPSAMGFKAKDEQRFKPMNSQPGASVQVAVQAKGGDELSYTLSGQGTFPDEQAEAGESGQAMGGQAANGRQDNRPGGGLGKPEDAPDGLAKVRWYILFALMTVLVGGGIWTRERTLLEAAASKTVAAAVAAKPEDIVAPVAQRRIEAPAKTEVLLAALKDELFQLEVEKQQGNISAEEYDKARAALEQTLLRVLQRNQG
jgi:hypothetical protein